jgi:PHP family Zn ribbon phosphoesterase
VKFVADLHLHSKYSRAVSQEMYLAKMAEYAKMKGISVLATGDFTHPFWIDRLKTELEEGGNGLYRLKTNDEGLKQIHFLLSCEISSIYSQGGKGRRIHTLFFFPSLSSVEKFNAQLVKRGANLRSDGRPIVGIPSRNLAEIALEVDEKALIIPAHAWTPWFSLYGSFSGFDSIEECFGDLSKYIYGIETGLSSDPAMNWQIEDLNNRAILSFSDAHSLPKMGREATVFEGNEVSYDCIYDAIANSGKLRKLGGPENQKVGKSDFSETSDTPKVRKSEYSEYSESKIAFTIEFYPEEGKYHFTGHRDCNYSQESGAENGKTCPVCKRALTVGVMDRVEQLKSKSLESRVENLGGVRWVYSDNNRPPFVSLVPLVEILSESLGEIRVGATTKRVTDAYFALVSTFGSEFHVLLKAKLDEISKVMPDRVAEAIEKVRTGDIEVVPGYDGKYGIVNIWPETPDTKETKENEPNANTSQLNLFAGG